MPKAFHKYTFTVTVLTDREIPTDMGLPEICQEADDGDFVMDYDSDVEFLTGKQMADALKEARSEPEFFELDDDGNSLEDDDE
jgi:hypothetical protein